MATRAAAKAHRQSLKRRLRNRMVRSATKTAVKKAEAAIGSGDLEAAAEKVRRATAALDRAAKKGVIHPNNAARRKSRLMIKYNAALAVARAEAEAAEAEAAVEEEEAPARGRRARKKEPEAKPKAKTNRDKKK